MIKVSAIIPTYNYARFLAAAVDSVLAQTLEDIEVVVVDDGSTDETESLMRGYDSRVRYVRQENSGVAVARNRGIEESRGQYVAFLDADDVWVPHKLERQLAALKKKTGLRACYAAFTLATSELSPTGINQSKRRASTLEDLLLMGNIIGTPSTVLCERSLFEEVSGFDTSFNYCADWEMWIRLAALTEFLYLDEPLVLYRQHDTNMSRNVSLLERESISLLEKGFAMPRLATSIRARRREAFARNYMVLAGSYFHAGRYKDFARCAARALALDIRQVNYLMAFPIRLAARLRTHNSAETV